MNHSITMGELPQVRWGAVITGTLCALAIQIALGLFGLGFGFAARPTDSAGLAIIAVLWNLFVPFVASAIGASVAVRNAVASSPRAAFLHGGLVWAIGLIAGALFVANTLAVGAMSPRPELGGTSTLRPSISSNRSAASLSTRETQALEERKDEAAKAAAASSALGGLAAIFALIGAMLGSEMGRRELQGEPLFGGRRRRGARYRHDRDLEEQERFDKDVPPAHPH